MSCSSCSNMELFSKIEQQRNVLAILYQIGLRLLMTSEIEKTERLLVSTFKKLIPMTSGFIIYKDKIVICPESHIRPKSTIIKTIYKLLSKNQNVMIFNKPEQLSLLHINSGSIILSPVIINDMIIGVMVAIHKNCNIYTLETIDIINQLSNISAASLKKCLNY